MRDFAVRTFRRFWIEWQQIEEVPTHASGEEGAIALLHTMTGSKNREEALRAYCFLLAIGRTPLTQTDVAHLFWDSDGNPSTPGEEKKKSYTTKQLEKKDLRKATVNARVLAIQENLDLGQVPGMKSQDAREVYAIRAGRVHEEKRKQIGLLWKEQPPNLLKQALSLPR